MNNNTLKIILAVALLLCLLPMPYGYYQLVRFVAMIGFGYLAFEANQSKKETAFVLFLGLAILFQPLIKIPLGRGLWNIVDVFVAIGLFLSVKKNNN